MSRWDKIGWVACWWVASMACGGEAPPPAPPSVETPRPTPPPAPEVAAVDATACAAAVPHGTTIGTFETDFGRGNTLALTLFRTDDAASDGLPEAGTAITAWGALTVGNVEELVGADVAGDLADPGAICVRATAANGSPGTGTIAKDERSSHVVDLVLTGQLPPKTSVSVVSALQADDDVRWIPWSDDIPGEAPYLHLRLGGDGQQGFRTALKSPGDMTGDIVVALVDGKGKAVVHTVTGR